MTSRDPKGARGSMVGYPSDSLASCYIIHVTEIKHTEALLGLQHVCMRGWASKCYTGHCQLQRNISNWNVMMLSSLTWGLGRSVIILDCPKPTYIGRKLGQVQLVKPKSKLCLFSHFNTACKMDGYMLLRRKLLSF